MKTSLFLVLFAIAFASTPASAQIDPAVYYNLTARHSGKCLAVSGGAGSVANGDAIIQWDCIAAEDNQKWQITPVADGYYKVIAKHSGKALDVYGGSVSTADGVIVHQWDYLGAGNQQWRFVPVGDGFYNIVARHSSKSLDVVGGPSATANGPRVHQWAYWGGSNQQWRLTPVAASGAPGVDRVRGTFTYRDSESEAADATTFPRPIAGALVQVFRGGKGLPAATTNTDAAGTFSIDVPHMVDGTDTTVLIYATNDAVQVLGGFGPFFVRMTQLSRGTAPLDFSANFMTAEQNRSFNVAHDIRLARQYAQARRDPRETDVIPVVDVTFMDHQLTGTRYNHPASGILLQPSHHNKDLVVMHEYAHFLEDKISSFLVLPSYHNGCHSTQRCPRAEDCATIPGVADGTQLVNSPENAWMEAFAGYFAMSVKRANPSERWNLSTDGTTPEWVLETAPGCAIVGRPAFDGRTITGEMIENFVASALWNLSEQPGAETAIFQIFDRELDNLKFGSLANIRAFGDAWNARSLDRAQLDTVLRVNIPTAVSTAR